MDSAGREPAGALGLSSASNELWRLEQALVDLAGCEGSEVSFLHCELPGQERRLATELTARARRRRFVTAQLSLLEAGGVGELDQLVRRLLAALDGGASSPGLPGLLEAFRVRHGAAAPLRWRRAADRWGAVGDLAGLALALVTAGLSEPALAAYQDWAAGQTPRHPIPGVRATLLPRHARRSLAELTRVVRALGHAGCCICLTDGDALARRSPRQRERAYTVLRELIDNFDGGRGMVSCRLLVIGGDALFEGPRSLRTLPALASRLATPGPAVPPPPHRSFARLLAGEPRSPGVAPSRTPPEQARALRTLIRISQGLPPAEAVAAMSVGHEQIDALIEQLLAHAQIAGSVFTVLQGEYGAGKTHLLLHLADRALEQGHPVFRLNLERLDFDLGNPARHLHRMLDDSEVPAPRRPSALEWLAARTRRPRPLAALVSALRAIARESSDAAPAARAALGHANQPSDLGQHLELYLSGATLEDHPATAASRREAYGLLLLWIELLQRLERWRGPVVLIDEAESLYTTGVARTARQSSLRSLAFYCGGALPSACVVLTSTASALGKLRYEAGELLHQLELQGGLVPGEDATMLRRRLLRLTPLRVPALTHEHRHALVERVLRTHAAVRGMPVVGDAHGLVTGDEPPRQLVRRVVDALEASWWSTRRELACPTAPVVSSRPDGAASESSGTPDRASG